LNYNEAMIRQLDAIYEDGVLRPLEPLPLQNAQRVKIIVSMPPDEGQWKDSNRSHRDLELLEKAKAEVASMKERPSLLEVQKMLSAIPGSLSADFIAEREDR
jgi:predicted DNA-binding antitoxin AbrB/MazE fold protein